MDKYTKRIVEEHGLTYEVHHLENYGYFFSAREDELHTVGFMIQRYAKMIQNQHKVHTVVAKTEEITETIRRDPKSNIDNLKAYIVGLNPELGRFNWLKPQYNTFRGRRVDSVMEQGDDIDIPVVFVSHPEILINYRSSHE